MTPEPPLGMTPDQRIAWDDGVEAFHRGLPITAYHPYFCAMKDVWELGWRESSEEAQMLPNGFQRWANLGALDYAIGGPRNADMTMNEWAAYVYGYQGAGRRAMASKAAAAALISQQLIDAWVAARDALAKHLNNAFPYGCKVAVDHPRYKGPGIMSGIPVDALNELAVKIDNGNTWHYPVTSVRRVP